MKLNLHKYVAVDVDKITDGVWYYPVAGIGFKLAYMGNENKNWMREIIKISGKLKRGKELSKEAVANLFAKIIIKDWTGLENEVGETIEYSVKAAEKLVTDASLSPFIATLISFAQEYKNFKDEDDEEDEDGEDLGKGA